jgi:hypothetical protein
VAAQAVSIAAGVLTIVGAGKIGSDIFQFESNSYGTISLAGATLSSYIVAAAIGILAAAVALVLLALRRRARRLEYLQAGLWLITLIGSIIVYARSYALFGDLYQKRKLAELLLLGDIPMVIAIVLLVTLAVTLRRAAS